MLLLKKLTTYFLFLDNFQYLRMEKMIKGKIGNDLTLEDGQKASKLCVINILAQVKKLLMGI